MKIWVDLTNSPHVLFFHPIIRSLREKGHKVCVTHREFAQTSHLCEIYGIDSYSIGQHAVQGLCNKIMNTFNRTFELRKFARKYNFDLACSHNSPAHCLAAKSLSIPYITIMDYEYQPANHINFRLADKVLVPFTFNLARIKKYGGKRLNLIKYPGLKEEVYLWQFEPNTNFWAQEFPEFDSSKIICTVRPPATMAAYHRFKNGVFNELLSYLLDRQNLQLIVFPRTSEQRFELKKTFPKLFLSNKTVDGSQLIANSDLIISAGGTMNREAAVLGTPAYTVYAGQLGSVDRYLIRQGKLTLINHLKDFRRINLRKNENRKKRINRKVFHVLVNELLNL